MNKYVKSYSEDAGADIVLDDHLVIRPGFQEFVLPAAYNPGENEVAFLIARGSTAAKGIFPISVAIDEGYEGLITAWVFNATNNTVVFDPGDRAFAIVCLKLGETRVETKILKTGKRGTNRKGSSGK